MPGLPWRLMKISMAEAGLRNLSRNQPSIESCRWYLWHYLICTWLKVNQQSWLSWSKMLWMGSAML